MVPNIPSELFRVLSHFSYLATWSNWSFLERGGYSFPGRFLQTWDWPIGWPKFDQAGWGQKTVSTLVTGSLIHTVRNHPKVICDLRSFPHNPTVENTDSHL